MRVRIRCESGTLGCEQGRKQTHFCVRLSACVQFPARARRRLELIAGVNQRSLTLVWRVYIGRTNPAHLVKATEWLPGREAPELPASSPTWDRPSRLLVPRIMSVLSNDNYWPDSVLIWPAPVMGVRSAFGKCEGGLAWLFLLRNIRG